jgi:hypothetical protein
MEHHGPTARYRVTPDLAIASLTGILGSSTKGYRGFAILNKYVVIPFGVDFRLPRTITLYHRSNGTFLPRQNCLAP